MESKALVTNPVPILCVPIVQSIAVYLHMYDCLAMIIEYRSALYTIIFMGVAYLLQVNGQTDNKTMRLTHHMIIACTNRHANIMAIKSL